MFVSFEWFLLCDFMWQAAIRIMQFSKEMGLPVGELGDESPPGKVEDYRNNRKYYHELFSAGVLNGRCH